ncbi:hypothetical protein ACOSP7_027194 [Xanthoceras sorbifolium]
MEKLSNVILSSVKNKDWRPVKDSRGGPGITHLFFADDIVFFGEAIIKQADIMRSCMDDLCRASGQQVMKNLNQSLLAKSSWRLLQNDSRLWSGIIRCKYLKGRPLADCLSDKSSNSYAWNGIAYGAKCTLGGLYWRVGDGTNFLFWTDSWVPNIGSLQIYALKELDQNQLNRKVSDFINEELWNYNLPRKHLSANIINHITSLHAGKAGSGKDKTIWGLSKDGKFSIKSAYNLISADCNPGICGGKSRV